MEGMLDEYVFQRLLLFSIPSLHGLIALPLTLTIAMSIRQGGGRLVCFEVWSRHLLFCILYF